MWRQSVASLAHAASGARWRCHMWRENVASLAHAVSGDHVHGIARCGVKMWRHLRTWRQAARWHRWSCAKVHANGLTWRHRTWRQRATWRRGAWRQNVAPSTHAASQDVEPIRVVRRPRPPGKCLQNVSSVVGRYVHPYRRAPCLFDILYENVILFSIIQYHPMLLYHIM